MKLETSRLLLRDFTPDDWPAVLAYQSDPRYLRYYHWENRSEEEVRALVQRFVDWQAEQPRLRYQLAVTLLSTGRLIGNCGLRKRPDNPRVAEMGFELAPDEWGRGYATEAASAMLDLGFSRLGLHRVSAHCIADNDASARVLRRLKMRQEGRLRHDQWIKGRWRDSLLFGLLADEWCVPGPSAPPRGVHVV